MLVWWWGEGFVLRDREFGSLCSFGFYCRTTSIFFARDRDRVEEHSGVILFVSRASVFYYYRFLLVLLVLCEKSIEIEGREHG